MVLNCLRNIVKHQMSQEEITVDTTIDHAHFVHNYAMQVVSQYNNMIVAYGLDNTLELGFAPIGLFRIHAEIGNKLYMLLFVVNIHDPKVRKIGTCLTPIEINALKYLHKLGYLAEEKAGELENLMLANESKDEWIELVIPTGKSYDGWTELEWDELEKSWFVVNDKSSPSQ